MFKRLEQLLDTMSPRGSIAPPVTDSFELDILLKEDNKIFCIEGHCSKGRSGDTISIVGTVGKKSDINKFSPSSIDGMDYKMLDSLINEKEAVAIFDSYIDFILADLGNKSPFYVNLLDSCIWEMTDNKHQVSTLAVSFDTANKKYRFYYNPSFILKGALAQYLYAKKDYTSLEECYIYMTKFYIVHEMSHITRNHMNALDNDLMKDVSPQQVNILGDSFINQTIPALVMKETKTIPPVIGIINEVSRKGRFKVETIDEVSYGLSSAVSKFSNASVSGATYLYTDVKDKEAVVILKMGDLLTKSSMGQGNSNLFISAIDKFFKDILTESQDLNYDKNQDSGDDTGDSESSEDTEAQPSPSNSPNNQKNEPEDNQEDDINNDGNGSNDSSQEDIDIEPEDTGEKGDKVNPNGGESSALGDGADYENTTFDDIVNQLKNANKASQQDKMKNEDTAEENSNGEIKPKDKTSQPKDVMKELSKEEKKAMQNIVKDALNKDASENLASMLGEEGYSKLTGKRVNVESKGIWRRTLQSVTSNALGVKEEWDSNAINARIEGELGREVEKPDLKSILIMIDCSGSMGPAVFKKVLTELDILTTIFKSRTTVHVVYWGTTQYYKKYKLDKTIYKKIVADAKGLGGTDYISALLFAQSKVKKPDVIIECTDFQYRLDENTIKSRKKWNKKTVWVGAPKSELRVLGRLDPMYKKRFIKLR